MKHCFSYTATKGGVTRGNSRHCRDKAHAESLVAAWNGSGVDKPKGHEDGTVYRFIGMDGKTATRPGDYGYAGSLFDPNRRSRNRYFGFY